MLREELLSATQNVLDFLDASGLIGFLEKTVKNSGNKIDEKDVLKFYQRYILEKTKLGDAEQTILDSLGLSILDDIQVWSQLLTSDRKSMIYHLYHRATFTKEQLPAILQLLKRRSDELIDSEHSDEILKAILIENEEIVSSTKRIVFALEAIEGLYNAISQLKNEEVRPLSVISCDSGSDKSFDLLGAAKVVKEVKDLILDLWNNIVYHRENKAGRQIELIANALPIMQEIADMRDSGNLEPERAELIKRQILESVVKIRDSGVIIPEVNDHASFQPRELMGRPQRKMLVQATESKHDIKKTVDDSDLEAYLEKKKKKFKKKQKKNNKKD